MKNFAALVVTEQDETVQAALATWPLQPLQTGEVRIKVAYSSVNFKDSLAVKKNGGVIRSYPMVPGIDLSGTICASNDERFTIGQAVLVTGYGLGVSSPGGFAEYATVPADWVVPLPKGLSLRDAMVFGTAGVTAALSIEALEKNGLCEKKDAQILITGATGGVGSLALAMLHRLGYRNLIALTRKLEASADLKALGAKEVWSANDFTEQPLKPLAKQAIDFAIDPVGDKVTSQVLTQLSYGGAVALSGNAGGIGLEATVLPFILRGVHLIGIDSVNVAMPTRLALWARLSDELNVSDYPFQQDVSLTDLAPIFTQLQSGTHLGRTIVKVTEE